MSNDLFSNFLSQLAAVASTPTTNHTIKISPITVRQIKAIVDQSLTHPYFDIGFKRELYKTLVGSIISDIELDWSDTLTELDAHLLFGYLKYDGKYKDLLIKDILEHINTHYTALQDIKTQISNFKNITVTLSSSTLKQSILYDDWLTKKVKLDKNNELENEEEVSNAFFLVDIAKYISSIQIDKQEIFTDEDVDGRIQIVGQLPYQIANEAVLFAKNINDFITKALTYKDITLPFDISFLE